jgi:hypothetical protein
MGLIRVSIKKNCLPPDVEYAKGVLEEEVMPD